MPVKLPHPPAFFAYVTPPQTRVQLPAAPRDERGYWRKGVSGNPAGRPASQGEAKRLARIAAAEVQGVLVEIAIDKDQPAAARVSAVKELNERGYGKAVQPVEIGGPGAFENMTDEELEAWAIVAAREMLDGTAD